MMYFRSKVNQFLSKKFGNVQITYLDLPINDSLHGFINRWHWQDNGKQGITIRIGALRLIYWKSVK